MRERLGDYELLHALRSGGMGDVLLARRRGPAGFEQLVAIKTVRADLAAAPLARAMFLDEARLLARLTHPGIAQILDFGETDGTAYMVMEYVPGMSFRGLADLRPPAPVLCQAVADACRGLHAAHELHDLVDGHLLGVVHRDISPDNLMLGYDARVKVLDFGIALVRGRQAPVTELGTVKGKPPYMSPEQLRNQPLDRRADVFSTAVVLWELLTGRALFEGDSIYAVARAVEHQEIVPPSMIAGRLPDELDDVVLAGLARDPERRLATAAAMAEVLERIAAAAGGESLEAWAERALRGPRESHRTWLAQILGGAKIDRPIGRATGMRTAIDAPVADDAPRETQLAPAPAPRVERPIAPASLEPPRKRSAIVSIAILILAIGAGAIWFATRDRSIASPPDAAPLDAPMIPGQLDAMQLDAMQLDAIQLDAAQLDAEPSDAGLDASAARRRDAAPASTPPIDASRPIDAATATPIDAAPRGEGILRIGAFLPAVRVSIDGVAAGETPVLRKKLPAGRHTVVLTDPSTSRVVRTVPIEIRAGETVDIQP